MFSVVFEKTRQFSPCFVSSITTFSYSPLAVRVVGLQVSRRSSYLAIRSINMHKYPFDTLPLDFNFPLVTVSQELLLVVEQFFVGLGDVFIIGSFNDGINWASFLAETAVAMQRSLVTIHPVHPLTRNMPQNNLHALGHVDIVTSGATRTILTGLSFNGDSLCWANSLAKFACNTTFFTCWPPFS